VYILRDAWNLLTRGLEKGDFQIMMRAAEETETTQQNIQYRLELDEGDPGFQRLVFL
jgi:hypothetical protein